MQQGQNLLEAGVMKTRHTVQQLRRARSQYMRGARCQLLGTGLLWSA